MNFSFYYPQGADPAFYMDKAKICASGGDCWTPRHCFGFIYYASLPFRFGWHYEALVGMNLLMLAISVALAGRAMEVLLPALARRGFFVATVKYFVIAMAHLAFMWGASHFPAADVPAACVGLIGIWLFILAWGRNNAWLLALSGLAIGTAFITRNFYFYPACVLMAVCLLAAFGLKRLSPSAAAGFILMAGLPILCQFALTYRHIKIWTQLDPGVQGQYESAVLSLRNYGSLAQNDDPVYGADGVGNAQAYVYTCHDCLSGPGGLFEAIARNDWKGLARLFGLRFNFYFGSFAGRPNLEVAGDRIFSGWILLANIAAILAVLVFYARMDDRLVFSLPMAYAGAVFGLAMLIQPESRYMMFFHTLLWVLAPLILLTAALSRRGKAALSIS